MENTRKTIVMADDNITTLNIAKNALMEKYDIFTVPSARKLFKFLEVKTPDLILLDVDMPEINGYEAIKILKNNKKTVDIPVVFLTAMINVENEMMGLGLGAIDYITKPFSAPLLVKRIEVHLLVGEQKKELEVYNTNLQQAVKKKTRTVFELQNVVLKTVAELVEFRDDITGRHIERTQNYLYILLKNLLKSGVYVDEISSWDINLLLLSAQLHDVGKIAIKDNILLKPARLTSSEFDEIKKHTVIGSDIIRKIAASTKESAFLKHAEIFAASHHEKWDGTGYPAGLKGYAIPLQGRLMAIIDVYDALTNERPYKKAIPHEEALEIIKSEIGTHFDPQVASVFLEYEKEIKSAVLESDLFSDLTQKQTVNGYDLQLTFTKTLEEIKDYREGISTKTSIIGRVASYTMVLVKALARHEKYKEQVSAWDIDLFALFSTLHDVGKLIVDDSILHKSQGLTENEIEKMREHTNHGVKIIKKVGSDIAEDDFDEHAEALAGSHHEKWDGTGYPAGLKGEEIPLQARIMAIIDVYDALTSDRLYKRPSSHKEAVAAIVSESGTRFDPHLIAIFIEQEAEFNVIHSMRQENI